MAVSVNCVAARSLRRHDAMGILVEHGMRQFIFQER
jgi:hypothetical protein